MCVADSHFISALSIFDRFFDIPYDWLSYFCITFFTLLKTHEIIAHSIFGYYWIFKPLFTIIGRSFRTITEILR